jgi:hypothetical protein
LEGVAGKHRRATFLAPSSRPGDVGVPARPDDRVMATTTSENQHEIVYWQYDDSQEGQGFVTFAGIMIAIAAVVNVIYGIAAIDDSSVFVGDAKYVFADLATWGWFLLVLGVVQGFAALAIWRGAAWGRWFGVGCALVNAFLQFLWFPGRPIVALSIMMLDLVALYGLLAHGAQRRAAREARSG